MHTAWKGDTSSPQGSFERALKTTPTGLAFKLWSLSPWSLHPGVLERVGVPARTGSPQPRPRINPSQLDQGGWESHTGVSGSCGPIRMTEPTLCSSSLARPGRRRGQVCRREERKVRRRAASQQAGLLHTIIASVLPPWWLLLEMEERPVSVSPLNHQGTVEDTAPGHFSPACLPCSPQ